jgi:hypothetical protein
VVHALHTCSFPAQCMQVTMHVCIQSQPGGAKVTPPSTIQVKHLKGVLNFSTVCYVAGLALASVCNPMAGNPIAAVLLSTAIFARWTMVGHHVSHGGYNSQQPDGACSVLLTGRR